MLHYATAVRPSPATGGLVQRAKIGRQGHGLIRLLLQHWVYFSFACDLESNHAVAGVGHLSG